MSRTALSSLREGYIAGLLSGKKSLREMVSTGLIGLSLSHSCRLMQKAPPDRWCERINAAPAGGYLAVDFVKVKHEGNRIEGVDRQYSSQGVIWGHRLLSSGLVYSDGRDPYLLALEGTVSRRHASEQYPYLSASEAMLGIAGDVASTGYALKGVVVDAEFITRLSLRSLVHLTVGVIGRFKGNNNVRYQDQTSKARDLAKQFPPGRARYYRKLKCYAKRLTVSLAQVGLVDMIIVWFARAKRAGWKLCLLVSTLKDHGLQALIRAFKARWGLEVSHRILKQNLALVHCQCLRFLAHRHHADFCVSALMRIRNIRQTNPSLSWKQAQKLAALAATNALLTAIPPPFT